MATTITKLLFRRGSDSDRTSTTLSMGEPGWVTVKNRLFVGDGTTAGGRAIPLTDERYFEWYSGSTDNTDSRNSTTGFSDDGTEFLTFNKNGLSALMSQHFVPQIPDDPSAGTDMIGDLRIGSGYDLSVGGNITAESLTIDPGNATIKGTTTFSDPGDIICHDITASGTVSITEDLTISGDLIVTGNTVTQEDISTKDNKVVLNVENVTRVDGGPSNDTGDAVGSAALAGIYIKHSGDTGASVSSYLRVASDPNNLELKAPGGSELTLDINSNSVYTAAGNLTVEDDSRIDQDLTTDATGVNFGSITMGSGTIGCGAITSTSAIAGTSLDVGTGTIASGAITSSSTIQGTTITATTNFAGDLTGDVTGNLAGDVTGDVTGDVDGTVGGNTPAQGTFTYLYANNRIGVAAGTESSPAIYFQDDSNTGFYHGGTNDGKIRVSTDGTERGYFSTNGWIGDVEGTVDGDITGNAYSATRVAINASSSTSSLRLVFTGASDVSDTDAILYKDTEATIYYQPGNNLLYARNVTLRPDGTNQFLTVDESDGIIVNNSGGDGDFRCKWDTGSTPEDSGNTAYALFVDTADARIGIGTNVPANTLDVKGSIRSSTDIYATNFHGDGSNLTNVPVDDNFIIGGDGSSYAEARGQLHMNGLVLPSITSSSGGTITLARPGNFNPINGGSVVEGNSTVNIDTILHSDGVEYLRFFWKDSSGNLDGVTQFDEAGNLRTTGNIVAFNNFSDRRLKKNIQPITVQDSIEKVSQLQPVSYNWIGRGSEDDQIGLIAQDVENIIPEVVTEDSRIEDNGDLKNYKRIDYEKIVPHLINCIHSLTNRVNELESQIQE